MLDIIKGREELNSICLDEKEILLKKAEVELRQSLKEIFNVAMSELFTNTTSQDTIDGYASDIKLFFNVKSLEDISIDMIRNVEVQDGNRWSAEMFNKGYAKNTINRRMESLKSFYEKLYVSNRQLVSKPVYSPLGEFGGYEFLNPFDTKNQSVRFKIDITDYKQARTLEKDEVQKMLNLWKDDSSLVGRRNYIMILMLYISGVRRNELRTIKLGDFIKFESEYSVVEIRGKGEKTRYIKIPRGVKAYIDSYLLLRGINYTNIDEPLFIGHSNRANPHKPMTNQSIGRIVDQTAEKCGIDSELVSTHSFRHTFITNARENGMSLETIADLVGHTSINTTKRYDHSYSYINESPSERMFEDIIEEVC